MLTAKRAEEAAAEIEGWAKRIGREVEPALDVEVYYDADSSTFVLRLVKHSRVLVFRLSESQVHTSGREAECERTLRRKIKDLWNLLR